jgi:putative transcriptional regulator
MQICKLIVMNIGEVIVDLRKQKGVKQKDLATALDISAAYLSQVEHNEEKPSVSLIANIANYFDLPVTAIFFKALDIDKLKNSEQRKYFKTAKPVVDALISYLLSDENPAKGKDPSRKTNRRVKT